LPHGLSLLDQVRQLRRQVAGYAATRTGRLVALTVSVPQDFAQQEALVTALRADLAAAGTPDVDIRAVPEDGPPRMVSAEFAR
jgi:hypothetical protein